LNKVSSIVLLLVLAASQSFSRPTDATDGVVTERKAYTFPSYAGPVIEHGPEFTETG